jgi:uncharacterized protein YkwD
MAGFELVRIGTVTEAAREWRIGRYLPLYLAGIAGGVAIGLGLTFYDGSGTQVERQTAPAVVSAPASTGDAPAGGSNAGASPYLKFVATIPLPQVDIDALFASVTPPEPAVAPAPVAPIAVAPEAPPQFKVSVPAQPAAPPVQPAAAPAVPQAAAPAAPAAPVAEAPAAAPAADARPNFYVPPVSSAGPSRLEQQLFDDINVERANAGLAPYSYDEGLTKIARTRSQQMADQNYFAHTDPNGYSMYTELLAYFGYDSYNWAGENLAMNNYAASEAAQRATVSLMNSSTHRANLLASDFFRVGIGEVTTADGRHIFTMIFLG